MEKREMLYEGKAKKVYKTDDENLYIVDYKDDSGMDIAAFEHGQLVHGGSCCGIFSNRAGKCDENFIRVQAGVAAAEILGF